MSAAEISTMYTNHIMSPDNNEWEQVINIEWLFLINILTAEIFSDGNQM